MPISRLAGRPRSPEVDVALFRAALSVIAEEGYERLTMERAAIIAGVSKASLYRRYSSRADLAAEALLDAHPIAPVASEGRAGAVERHLMRVFAVLAEPVGAALRGLMADAQLDHVFRETFRDRFIHVRREALADAIRLEFGETDQISLVLDLALGAMWYRLLVGHALLDSRAATEIADVVRTLCGHRTSDQGL